MNSIGRHSIPKWTSCNSVSELAALIDAVPPNFRARLLRAVLMPEMSALGDLYFVGMLRSRLGDSLHEAFGVVLQVPWQGGSDETLCVDSCLTEFESCRDLAQVQLAICDLLTVLAVERLRGVKTDESQSSFSI